MKVSDENMVLANPPGVEKRGARILERGLPSEERRGD